jgi:ribosomal protein S18 acetylase RimI-like enzyme
MVVVDLRRVRYQRVITVRSGREDDIPSVLRIWTAASSESTVTDDELGVRALLHRDPDALLVAEVDGTTVGTLIATWDGWRAHFYRLAVLPGHRRRGIARALVDAAERRFDMLDVRRLNAIVVDGDGCATGFWRAAGYEAQTRRLRFVKNRP